jgi:ElaB/YqjD/DUF883 family membrane-anchored ribosome-binding protein
MESKDISETREALVSDASKLKENVGQIAQDVKDHATAHVDFVRDKANDTFQKLSDYAREKPLHLAGAAFVLGLFIGYTRRK